MLLQAFNIIIEHEISTTGHTKEFVDGLNATGKRFIFHLMATVQLRDSQSFDTQMKIHTLTHNDDVSLLQAFQNTLSNASLQNGILNCGKTKKVKKKMEK